MLMNFLLKGVLIGFSIAMPVGPIGLLCIRNSLSWGRRYGLMTGMGAAAADALYGAMAGLGLVALTNVLVSYRLWFHLIGGIFLCYLGLCHFLAQDSKSNKEMAPKSLFGVFLTTFLLTLTNPMTILSFIAIYAGLGIGIEENYIQTCLILTLGIFLGSAAWWLLLSSSASLFKSRLKPSATTWLNRASGAVLIGFGFAALLSGLTGVPGFYP